MPKLAGSEAQRLELARFLIRAGVAGFSVANPQKFRGGTISPWYMNCRMIQGCPAIAASVGGAFADAARHFNPDVIAGIQNGAIPHSFSAAQKLVLPHRSIRKEVKDHGIADLVEGGSVDGRKVVLIEDIVSEAGSLLHGVKAVTAAKGTVVGCLAIMSYNLNGADQKLEQDHGLLFTTLVSLRDMTQALAEEVMGWNENPSRWLEQWYADQGSKPASIKAS